MKDWIVAFINIAVILSTLLSRVLSECCESVAISSSSVGRNFQEHQLGIYTIRDELKVNDRPVYKQEKGDQYLYYWVFDQGRHDDGENWLVRQLQKKNQEKDNSINCSNDYDNWRHGIESPNMKGETVDNGFGVHEACEDYSCGNR